MADYITKIRTTDGDKQIDYNALANLPTFNGEALRGNQIGSALANALKGSAVGEAIRIDDVSPVEHNVSCRLTSDAGIDFSTVKVIRCGKNLYDSSEELSVSKVHNGYFVTDENSMWHDLVDIDTLPEIFTISTMIICSDYGRVDGSDTSLRLYYYDKDKAELDLDVGSVATAENPKSVITFNRSVIPEGTKYVGLRIRINTAGYTMNSQIEVGSTATEYEAYKGTTYTPNEDGTCDVVSVSPTMTLLTDTAGAIIECEYNRDINAVLAKLLTPARIANVTLKASAWTGANNLYSQVVTIAGITANSQVDLTPSVEQLAIFYQKDIAFVAENEDGVVTVYVIGDKPTLDYTMQATITEVTIYE